MFCFYGYFYFSGHVCLGLFLHSTLRPRSPQQLTTATASHKTSQQITFNQQQQRTAAAEAACSNSNCHESAAARLTAAAAAVPRPSSVRQQLRPSPHNHPAHRGDGLQLHPTAQLQPFAAAAAAEAELSPTAAAAAGPKHHNVEQEKQQQFPTR